MTQPKMLFRCIILATLLFLIGCSPTLAQTVNDSNQDQTYGVWKVPNPQTPGIQFRAKCNSDSDATGRMMSEWSFQFRNNYKGTMDFIYLNEGGIDQPAVNKMIGPFLNTLKPGEIYSNGAQLYGSCSEHATVKTGIHVTIKCAVPTGQDAPCFKDADGNPYPQAARVNLEAKRLASKSSDKTKTFYWSCDGGRKSEIGTGNSKEVVQTKTIFLGPEDDSDRTTSQKYSELFKESVIASGKLTGSSDEIWAQCFQFPTRDSATSQRVPLPKDTLIYIDWTPAQH
jgi:hypothetical protein